MKFTFKGLGIAILVALSAAALGVLLFVAKQRIDASKPLLKPFYYESFKSSSLLEKKYSQRGQHNVDYVEFKVQDPDIVTISAWYPAGLATGAGRYPMIVVVNGSNTKASMYKPFFERLASWGFIVVGTEDAQAGKGNTTSRTLDFMLRLDRDSVLYDRIDPKAVGVVGYSQGGAGAIRAVSEHPNGTVFKAIFTGSAAYSELARNMGWAYDTRKVSVPYFMTAGTGASDDSGAKNTLKEFGGVAPLSSLSENYGRMPDAVSKVRGRVIGAEHWQIQLLTDGYMTAWMLYQLLGDVEAAAVFVGAHAEILRNSNWQDVVKSE